MVTRQAIVVGASAGGLEALLAIVKDLPAALLVVIHCAPNFPNLVPEVLSRHGPLPAAHPQDGEEIRPGHIYLAPPDRHLAVLGNRLRVWFGPKVNGFRPAIDPLFRSAAEQYGAAAVGVILSGGMTDGVAGLLALQRDGGVTRWCRTRPTRPPRRCRRTPWRPSGPTTSRGPRNWADSWASWPTDQSRGERPLCRTRYPRLKRRCGKTSPPRRAGNGPGKSRCFPARTAGASCARRTSAGWRSSSATSGTPTRTRRCWRRRGRRSRQPGGAWSAP